MKTPRDCIAFNLESSKKMIDGCFSFMSPQAITHAGQISAIHRRFGRPPLF